MGFKKMGNDLFSREELGNSLFDGITGKYTNDFTYCL
jgi:hypothetical protein